MGARSAEKLVEGIAASRDRGLARLLYGLAIRHVGVNVARILATEFRSWDALAVSTVDELSGVHEIGEVIAQSVHAFCRAPAVQKVIAELKNAGVSLTQVVKTDNKPGKLQGKTIVVTGTLVRFSRKEIEDQIRQHGGRAASSVSAKTDYVVAGEKSGSKLDKARELKIPILTEQDLLELLD
jgi:DNA ligase (NAD+)